jgi:hypothetical protein
MNDFPKIGDPVLTDDAGPIYERATALPSADDPSAA